MSEARCSTDAARWDGRWGPPGGRAALRSPPGVVVSAIASWTPGTASRLRCERGGHASALGRAARWSSFSEPRRSLAFWSGGHHERRRRVALDGRGSDVSPAASRAPRPSRAPGPRRARQRRLRRGPCGPRSFWKARSEHRSVPQVRHAVGHGVGGGRPRGRRPLGRRRGRPRGRRVRPPRGSGSPSRSSARPRPRPRGAARAPHGGVVVSSAPVGSSAKRTAGRVTSARAIATRCCCPPDSSDGRWLQPVQEAPCAPRTSCSHSRSSRGLSEATGRLMF